MRDWTKQNVEVCFRITQAKFEFHMSSNLDLFVSANHWILKFVKWNRDGHLLMGIKVYRLVLYRPWAWLVGLYPSVKTARLFLGVNQFEIFNWWISWFDRCWIHWPHHQVKLNATEHSLSTQTRIDLKTPFQVSRQTNSVFKFGLHNFKKKEITF